MFFVVAAFLAVLKAEVVVFGYFAADNAGVYVFVDMFFCEVGPSSFDLWFVGVFWAYSVGDWFFAFFAAVFFIDVCDGGYFAAFLTDLDVLGVVWACALFWAFLLAFVFATFVTGPFWESVDFGYFAAVFALFCVCFARVWDVSSGVWGIGVFLNTGGLWSARVLPR